MHQIIQPVVQHDEAVLKPLIKIAVIKAVAVAVKTAVIILLAAKISGPGSEDG